MNYRVDGWIDGTKNTGKCFLQPSAAKKEWLPLSQHVPSLFCTKRKKEGKKTSPISSGVELENQQRSPSDGYRVHYLHAVACTNLVTVRNKYICLGRLAIERRKNPLFETSSPYNPVTQPVVTSTAEFSRGLVCYNQKV